MSRQQTGKTPISTILSRWGCVLSLPLLPLALVFAIGGGLALFPILALAYVATCTIGTFLAWLGTNATANALWPNDPDYRAWKKGGGDPFFDALGIVNNDSGATRAALPPDAGPPAQACPRCGGALTLWHGFQCGTCYSYYKEGRWWFWVPDPRTVHRP